MKNSKKRKPRRRKQVVPSQPNDIPYSKYRIEWTDALSDSGWADDREFTKMKLAKPINEGWVFSKDKNSVKIFASYDLDPTTKEKIKAKNKEQKNYPSKFKVFRKQD